MKRILFLSLLSIFCLSTFARIIRVNPKLPNGIGPGDSWKTAYSNLQSAINIANDGDEIWISAGTIIGNISCLKPLSFYGGFIGTENNKEERVESTPKPIFIGTFDYTINRPISDQINVIENCTFYNKLNFTSGQLFFNFNLALTKNDFNKSTNLSFSGLNNVSFLNNTVFDVTTDNFIQLFSIQNFTSISNKVSKCSFSSNYIHSPSTNVFEIELLNDELIDNFIKGDFFASKCKKITINNVIIRKNRLYDLGGIYVVDSKVFIDGLVYDENISNVSSNVPLFQFDNSETQFINSIFSNNQFYIALFKSSLDNRASSFILDNCVFKNNVQFGSHDFFNQVPLLKNDKITNCQFISNEKRSPGNFISFNEPNSSSNLVFKSNIVRNGSLVKFNELSIDKLTCVNNSSSASTFSGKTLDINQAYIDSTNSSGGILINVYNSKIENAEIARSGILKSTNNLTIQNSSLHHIIAKSDAPLFADYVTIDNSLIYDNSNLGGLAGVISAGSHLIIDQSTFYNNTNSSLTNQFFRTPNASISNSILWGLKNGFLGLQNQQGWKISNSIVQNGFIGSNNLDVDPLFIEPELGDFHLSCQSPAIDAGDYKGVLNNLDLDGAPRVVGQKVDLGCYESQMQKTLNSEKISFNLSKSLVCKTENITFQYTTKDTVSTFFWNLGDGTFVRNLKTVNHAYAKSGKYAVKLYRTRVCGELDSIVQNIEVSTTKLPSIFYPTTVCSGTISEFYTDATCTDLVWTVNGGEILTGQHTSKITVKWGNGLSGNGVVGLNVGNCTVDFCPISVELVVPIVPERFDIVGKTFPCVSDFERYKTNLNPIAGIWYSWSVKNGTINGKSEGYNLSEIDVLWSSLSTKGMIYLETNHELLQCSRVDSFPVEILQKINIQGLNSICENSQVQYTNGGAIPVSWQILNSNSTISVLGKANWEKSGVFQVVANRIQTKDYCNQADTIEVTVNPKPKLSSIFGEVEVDSTQIYTYSVTSDLSNVAYKWEVLGASFLQGSNTKTLTTKWGTFLPYQLKIYATSNDFTCVSDTSVLNLKQAFSFYMTGVAKTCLQSEAIFELNEDKGNVVTYTWLLNGVDLNINKSKANIYFDQVGVNQLKVEILRLGKKYVVTKEIFVEAEPQSVSVQGETTIAPTGDYFLSYKIINPQLSTFDLNVSGGDILSQTNSKIDVNWTGQSGLSIYLNALTKGKTCPDVPIILNVTRAPLFTPTLTKVEGNNCLNSEVTYEISSDLFVKDLKWTIIGDGVILNTDKNKIKIKWNNTAGIQKIKADYFRFENKTIEFEIDLLQITTPTIVGDYICGNSSLTLGLNSTYSTYKWTKESDLLNVLSTSDKALVNEEGLYNVSISDGSGCVASVSKFIRAVPKPIVEFYPFNSWISCQSNSSQLVNLSLSTFSGNNYTYKWYKNGNLIPNEDKNTLSTVTFDQSKVQNITYTVKASLQNCESQGDYFINVISKSSSSCQSSNNNNNPPDPCLDLPVSFNIIGYQPFKVVNTTTTETTKPWYWNFENGSSNLKQPIDSFTFSKVGVYTFYLNRGCAYDSKSIEVPVISDFSPQNLVCSATDIQFNNYSTTLPNATFVSCVWDYGDGSTQTITAGNINGTHIYKNPGSYNVKLTMKVKDSNGVERISSKSKQINVLQSPISNFTYVPASCYDNLIRFVNTSEINTSVAKYLWDYDNGTSSTSENGVARYTDYLSTKNISLTVTNSMGCSNKITKSVFIYDVTPQAPITVNGSLQLCNNNTVSLTSPSSINGVYVWKKNNQVFDTNKRTIVASTPGKYTVSYQLSETCTAYSDTITVSNFDYPLQITGKSDLCESDTLSLSVSPVNDNYTLQWYKGNVNANYFGNTYINTAVKIVDGTSYQVEITELKSGCKLKSEIYPVKVNSIPPKPQFNATDVVCNLGSVVLKDDNQSTLVGYNRIWSVNGIKKTNLIHAIDTVFGLVGPNDYIINLNYTSKDFGCTSASDSKIVHVLDNIKAVLSIDQEYCEGQTAKIQSNLVNTEFNFNWFKNKDGNIVELKNTGNAIEFNPVLLSDSGSYFLKAYSVGSVKYPKGCSSISNVVYLKIKEAPKKPIISGKSEVCEDTPLVLTVNQLNNLAWSTGEKTPSITVFKSGTYKVKVIHPISKCESEASKSVQINPLPELSFLTTGVYDRCGNTPLDLKGLTSLTQFQWYKDGTAYGAINESLFPNETGNYTLSSISDKGCKAVSDTLRIISKLCGSGCVVTNTKDSGAGSLRDAIICANTSLTKMKISFQIPGEGPHIISPLTALPTLKKSLSIDGFTQAGENKYAIVLVGSNNLTRGFEVNSGVSSVTIRGIIFQQFDQAILVGVGNSLIRVENNKFLHGVKNGVILNDATYNNTISKNQFDSTEVGIQLNYRAKQNTITSNIFTNQLKTALILKDESSLNNVVSNTFVNGYQAISQSKGIHNSVLGNTFLNFNTAFKNVNSNETMVSFNFFGVSKDSLKGKLNFAVIANATSDETYANNTFVNADSIGLSMTKSNNTLVQSNTFGTNDFRNKIAIRTSGNNVIQQNNFTNNIIGIETDSSTFILSNNFVNQSQEGILVNNNLNRVSKNTFLSTAKFAKAINLNSIGNGNKQAAIFTSFRKLNSNILLEGKGKVGDTVEVFLSQNKNQQATKYLGSSVVNSNLKWSFQYLNSDSTLFNQKIFFVNTASEGNNTSELSSPYQIGCFTCVCYVTNASDSQIGSFRAALDSAHTGKCYTIKFEIPTSDTISIKSSLRSIDVPLTIFGDLKNPIKGLPTDTALTINSSDVTIKDLVFVNWKSALILNGDSSKINNIQIQNTQNPIVVNGDKNSIVNSKINTPNSTYKSDVLIRVTGNNNIIGGKDKGNSLFAAHQEGILIDAGTNNAILNTTIENTSNPLLLLNQGNLNYASLKNVSTTIIGDYLLISGEAKKEDLVQLFLSDSTLTSVSTYIDEQKLNSKTNWSFKIPYDTVLTKDLFFLISSTSNTGNTSSFLKYNVKDYKAQKCIVYNTENKGPGSLREAILCANNAGEVDHQAASIIFDLPKDTLNQILVLDSGFVLRNKYGITIDASTYNVRIKGSEKISYAFKIENGNTFMKDFAVTNFNVGIQSSGSFISLKSLEIDSVKLGMQLEKGHDVLVENNKIRFSKKGVVADSLENSVLIKNQIEAFGNQDSVSILAINTENMLINQNQILNYSLNGILLNTSDHCTVFENIVYSSKSNHKALDFNETTSFVSNNQTVRPEFLSFELVNKSQLKLVGKSKYSSSKIGVYQSFESKNQSLKFLDSTLTNEEGYWIVFLDSSSFKLDANNMYVAQVQNDKRSSELSDVYSVSKLLCEATKNKILLVDSIIEPCPNQILALNTTYSAFSQKWESVSDLDLNPDFVSKSSTWKLTLSDSLGCTYSQALKVQFKNLEIDSSFNLLKQVYVDDTVKIYNPLQHYTDSHWEIKRNEEILEPTWVNHVFSNDDNSLYFIAKDTGIVRVTRLASLQGCPILLEDSVLIVKRNDSTSFQEIYVYPSPSIKDQEQYLHIQTISTDEIPYKIYSTFGIKLFEGTVSNQLVYNEPLNKLHLSPGLYIMKVESPQGLVTIKFQVAHFN